MPIHWGEFGSTASKGLIVALLTIFTSGCGKVFITSPGQDGMVVDSPFTLKAQKNDNTCTFRDGSFQAYIDRGQAGQIDITGAFTRPSNSNIWTAADYPLPVGEHTLYVSGRFDGGLCWRNFDSDSLTFEVLETGLTELAIESQFFMDYLSGDSGPMPPVPSPLKDIVGNHNGYQMTLCDVTYSHVSPDGPDIGSKATVVHSSNWNLTFTGPDAAFLNSEFQFTQGGNADPTRLFKVRVESDGTFNLNLYLYEDPDPMGNFTETIEVYVNRLPAGTFNLNAAGFPIIAPFTHQDPGTGHPIIRTILRDFFGPGGPGTVDMYVVSNDTDGGSPAWPDTFSLQPFACP